MRGITMASFLNQYTDYTVQCVYVQNVLKNIHTYSKQFDIFIFVKMAHIQICQALYQMDKIVIFDPVDNFDFNKDVIWHNTSNTYVHYTLASNSKHKAFIMEKMELSDKQVPIIEIHHSNFANQQKDIDTIKTCGYVGFKYQFEPSNRILQCLATHNVQFYMADKIAKTNEEAIQESIRLDCLLIYFTKQTSQYTKINYQYMLDFKPVQKLTLFFSLGIPVIFLPYCSYIEAIQHSGFSTNDFLIAHHEDDVIKQLQTLLSMDKQTLQSLINRQKKVAQNYHINSIAHKYIDLFKRIAH